MGCGSSSEEAAPPPPKTGGYKPPPEPTPEELEAKRLEAEKVKIWEDKAREANPPPFPKPEFAAGDSEEAYKQFMIDKLEYEGWENSIILTGRKMRAEAGE